MQISGFRPVSLPQATLGSASPAFGKTASDNEKMAAVLKKRYPLYWKDERHSRLVLKAEARASQDAYWRADVAGNRKVLEQPEVRDALAAIPLDTRQAIASAAKALGGQKHYQGRAVVGQRSENVLGNVSTELNPNNIIALKAEDIPTIDEDLSNKGGKTVAGCIDIIDHHQAWFTQGGVRESFRQHFGLKNDGLYKLIRVNIRHQDPQADARQRRDVITNVLGIYLPEEGFVPLTAHSMTPQVTKQGLARLLHENNPEKLRMLEEKTALPLSSPQVLQALRTMVELLPDAHFVQWDTDTLRGVKASLRNNKPPVAF